MLKTFKLATALVLATLALSSCSTQSIDLNTVDAVVDVRTPAEFASGHLQGAINIDVESANFATEIESLDKAGDYLIYCHSGRRAGLAVDYMTSHGFTGDVQNIGGIDEAASVTKLPVVTN